MPTTSPPAAACSRLIRQAIQHTECPNAVRPPANAHRQPVRAAPFQTGTANTFPTSSQYLPKTLTGTANTFPDRYCQQAAKKNRPTEVREPAATPSRLALPTDRQKPRHTFPTATTNRPPNQPVN
eukprot:365368-Chlamydomonas_euryale.AAC.5